MLATESDTSSGNTKVSVALIAPDDDRRQALAKSIGATQARILRELRQYPTHDALSTLIEDGCDVIIVDLTVNMEVGLALIEAISRQDPSITVMACGNAGHAEVIIGAMRAGAREFILDSNSAAALSEALVRASARRPTRPAGASGKILVFQGAKGGTGVSTIATNFAFTLTKENAGNVVLVDLHAQLGEIALGLGLTPKFTIADALTHAGRLDADFMSTVLAKHDSGLMVLGSSDVYDTHRSLDHGADKLFRILREEFAFVVVDAGSSSGAIPDALFGITDTVFLVAEANLPALRNARRVLTHFAKKDDGPDVELVMNRFDSKMAGIDEESITEALGRAIDWRIPNAYMTVRGAQNLGVPLGPDSPVSRVISGMVRATSGKSAAVRGGKTASPRGADKWKFWNSSVATLSPVRS